MSKFKEFKYEKRNHKRKIDMGKGFDTFMKNPYWKKQYENAPGDTLREYLKIVFETSPFVYGAGYENKELEKRASTLVKRFTKSDVQYLYDNAVGGNEKVFYKKWLDKFED